MKLFVLVGITAYEPSTTLGVYSTKEKADEAAKHDRRTRPQWERFTEYEVLPFELDA